MPDVISSVYVCVLVKLQPLKTPDSGYVRMGNLGRQVGGEISLFTLINPFAMRPSEVNSIWTK